MNKEKIEEQKQETTNSTTLEQNTQELQAPEKDDSMGATAGSKKLSPKGIAALVGAAAAVIAGILIYTNTPQYRYARALESGYRSLVEMDYEQAIVFFEEAIGIEPKSYDAMVGLMNAAQGTENGELLTGTLESLLSAAESDESLWEFRGGEITQMAMAAQPYYTESQEYLSVLNRVQAKREDEQVIQVMIGLLQEEADQQWQNSDYEKALTELKKAYELDPDKETILAQLEKLIRDYAVQLRDNQQYDKAEEMIAWLEGIKPETDMEELKASITEANQTDQRVQAMIEGLNTNFDADDVDAIRESMLAEEWKEGTGDIYRTFYSESLLGKDTIEGEGTAIYNVNGYLYVYYGSFVDGMRQGEGRWYYASDDGTLVKYTLNWEKDLPNGEGTLDQYDEVTTVGPGGVELYTWESHEINNFQCIKGVYHGAYNSRIQRNGNFFAELNFNLNNGYSTPMPDSEVPEEIRYYMRPGQQIVAYSDTTGGGNLWQYYSPSRWSIPGLVPSRPVYSVEEIELNF